MKKNKKMKAIIFDMDGTLYHFDKGTNFKFRESSFGRTIFINIENFFMSKFSFSRNEAKIKIQDLDSRFNGEISFGLEQEYGISRSEYFQATWNLEPSDFMKLDENLSILIDSIPVTVVLLTAAPRVWATKVLKFLQIEQLFGKAVFTGDSDIRKPDPQVFKNIADFLSIDPQSIISVGDQEHTDILPARSIGMTTVRIGVDNESEADFMAVSVVEAIAILKKENII